MKIVSAILIVSWVAIVGSAASGHPEQENLGSTGKVVSAGQEEIEATPGFPAVKQFITTETKNILRNILAKGSYIGSLSATAASCLIAYAPIIVALGQRASGRFPDFFRKLSFAGQAAFFLLRF